MSDLNTLRQDIFHALEQADTLEQVNQIRIDALGKKGTISGLMKQLGRLSVEEKKEFGAQVNILKKDLLEAIDQKNILLNKKLLDQKLANETLDISLPPRPEYKGSRHPISFVMKEVIDIFAPMGFTLEDGPEIETEDFNFTKLNIPQDHPARQMHDTFYLEHEGDAEFVLRTHTSPIQIRAMLNKKPPLRLLAPGKTFRCDSDMTHTPMFHQLEGLVLEEGITMGHLRGTLEQFCKVFFEKDDITLRFRPSFFPFTEPSIEVDIKCNRQKGHITIGDGEDWLEILGAGMIHPNVLKNCGYNAQEIGGFAFGIGLDRLAMLKYGIPDLRHFFEGRKEWLEHYNFA